MIKRAFIWGMLVLGLATAYMYWYAHTSLPLKQTPLEFDLKPGSNLVTITSRMQAAGVMNDGLRFRVLARIMGKAGKIKAGFYTLNQQITPLQLLTKLTAGEVSLREIVFIEGWTFAQMRDALNAHPLVKHETLGMSEQQVLQLLNIPLNHAEGWFFPSTYYIDAGSSDVSILRRAYETMQMHLQHEWAGRDKNLPYATPADALTMASIIEKETGVKDERPLIAAVFINRLRLGMRLQTDPTVIYGIGKNYDGNIRKRDLLADTPYNTYTRAGLPPTAIAMPGLDSIKAALHPAHSDIIYFVAKGDGTHYFSNNLVEHNRAVARYQKNG
ncbi:aminodeoxychorismate lyase [Sulfuriferula sp. AH1]|uniref:endolytic transglycosylase MltG n=1 Tax=Sulfuriferula sp. AH1 TaxID=1985873 RepID=UPI000B3B22B7|nr:endolytic transglycosylase MltG [Sulfuriferula sp. AH1]ARU31623.1 aminodeoxychorismate lyase [Sulfuriferula sp. AH1]